MESAGWFFGVELAEGHRALSLVQRGVARVSFFCFVNSCRYIETDWSRIPTMINATAEQFQDKENTVRAVIVNSTIFGRPIVDLLRKEVTNPDQGTEGERIIIRPRC